MENLRNWRGLNDELRHANEEECIALLKFELATKRRRQFLRRIHSRLNKLRADRERGELDAASASYRRR